MQAKSFNGNSAEEIKTALQLSMADGFKPTLVFAFCSVKQDIDAIRAVFENEHITVFGATIAGEIGRAKNARPEFHSTTISRAVLKER